jgi:hypothetical protein
MSEYMKILRMIEEGEISPDEGAELLQNLEIPQDQENDEARPIDVLSRLDSGEINTEEALNILNTPPNDFQAGTEVEFDTHASPPPEISDEELRKWKQWWMIPMYVGVAIAALSGLWINSAYQSSGYGFWFFCAWLPMLIGVLFIALSLGSRSGPWIHVRVRGPKERVAISIPAPLKFTGWILNNFGHYIPKMDAATVEQFLMALENVSRDGTPLYVHVDEGDDGEKVDVFIG